VDLCQAAWDLLKALVHEAEAPLRAVEMTFAIDSTGFATSTHARWFDESYGAEKRCPRWIKLHAQVGTKTNVIASVEATESTIGDSVMLAPLLASSVARGFDVREVSADKAYLSNDNLTAIEAAGAVLDPSFFEEPDAGNLHVRICGGPG
jgi:Transposase DDE domain